jgi:60 kDa SS-A/Ro ribonucleoprotein
MSYLDIESTRRTPQSRAIPGSGQVPNSAGGFAWSVDDWERLRRFLILGSEGGTYYVGQHDLTRENMDAVRRCLDEDGLRVVREVVDVSTNGRAVKQDPGLFVLALAA